MHEVGQWVHVLVQLWFNSYLSREPGIKRRSEFKKTTASSDHW